MRTDIANAADEAFESLRLDNQLCFPLYAVSRLVTQAYRPYLDELGLTYPKYLVLLVLWERDGARVGEIGDRLMLDSGTLTPLLKSMERNGLLTRKRRRGDDRSVENWLTRQGRALQTRAIEIPTKLVCSTALENAEVASLKEALVPVLKKLVAYHQR
jgi:DNA-binding MarR family transcriptional regulator